MRRRLGEKWAVDGDLLNGDAAGAWAGGKNKRRRQIKREAKQKAWKEKNQKEGINVGKMQGDEVRDRVIDEGKRMRVMGVENWNLTNLKGVKLGSPSYFLGDTILSLLYIKIESKSERQRTYELLADAVRAVSNSNAPS